MNSPSTGEAAAVTAAGLSLESPQLDAAFPFHFALDRAMRVVRAGPVLQRLLPAAAGAVPFERLFDIGRPFVHAGFDEICRHCDELFLLKARALPALLLRGQMLALPPGDVLLFLGAPWLAAGSDLGALGLGVKDFAIHDAAPDYLFAMRTQTLALAEAQALGERLALRNDELEQRIAARTREMARTNDVLTTANRALRQGIAARRRAEDKFRGVLDAAPEAMLIIDDQRRIALVNAQAQALFGYAPQELMGQPVELLMPERFRGRHAEWSRRYLAAPRVRPMGRRDAELYGLTKDGREFPAEISLSPLHGGESVAVVCTVRDVSERVRIEQELVASREKLRELAAHHDAVREQERKRIAGEVHDELGSLLTALKMDIALLRMGAADAPALQQRVGQMRELVEQTLEVVRHVATQLRPAALNLGIVAALEWLVEDFGRRTGIACRLDACCEPAMDDARATAVFRIVQESLTNVARHSGASAVTVTLARGDDGHARLSLCDNGCGFDPRAPRRRSFGLLGMRERALVLGTELSIESAPGAGTTVALVIPAEAPS